MPQAAGKGLSPGRQRHEMAAGGIRFSVECDFHPGAVQAVLFIHGLACSAESFRHVFARDYFPGRSLILPDLPGFGRSGKPEDFSYSMEDQALLLEALLAEFPGQALHVVAHSMGGAVALLFSPALLARIQSFACLEGNLIASDCGLLSRSIAATAFAEYEARAFPRQREEFRDHAELRFGETTPLAVHRSARSLVQWSDSGRLLERFGKLACRKAYFWGEEDRAMPVLDRLQGIETIMIPRSGHGMMTDNPSAFYRALAGFVGP